MSKRGKSITKFDTYLAEVFYFYGLSLDGGPNDEVGSSAEAGWFGLFKGDLLDQVVEAEIEDEDGEDIPCIAELETAEIREVALAKGAILSESTSGSVGITFYDSEAELDEAWRKIQSEVEPDFEGDDTDADEGKDTAQTDDVHEEE